MIARLCIAIAAAMFVLTVAPMLPSRLDPEQWCPQQPDPIACFIQAAE